MKIIADNKIPFLEAHFAKHAELITLPAEAINREQCADADCVLLRSVTPADQNLLESTAVKFVGSATAGTDHLDIPYFEQMGIAFAHAPGANAKAVADYVFSCIAALRLRGMLNREKIRAGIIGVGRVGQQVENLLSTLGFEILLNDPPRAAIEADFTSTALADFSDLDLICLHTPLTFTGEFPSYHLLNSEFLSRQKLGCVLLNAGRGAIIDTSTLLQATHLTTVLDVWENEPDINLALLKSTTIATPHIAGYSLASKRRATQMLYQAFCNHFTIKTNKNIDVLSKKEASIALTTGWERRVMQIENLWDFSNNFKQQLIKTPDQISKQFKHCRQNYPLRSEFLLTK